MAIIQMLNDCYVKERNNNDIAVRSYLPKEISNSLKCQTNLRYICPKLECGSFANISVTILNRIVGFLNRVQAKIVLILCFAFSSKIIRHIMHMIKTYIIKMQSGSLIQDNRLHRGNHYVVRIGENP